MELEENFARNYQNDESNKNTQTVKSIWAESAQSA